MGLDAQQAWRIGKHRPRIRLGEAITAQQVEEYLRMAPTHIGVTLTLSRAVAEVTPPVDHLLGRAPTDPKLQTTAGDEVGSARIFDHVERVLVAHVDNRRSDFDTAGLGAH